MDSTGLVIAAYVLAGAALGVAVVKVGPKKNEEVSQTDAWRAIAVAALFWPALIVWACVEMFSKWLVKPNWR